MGTYADDPSQTGIESALLEVDAGPIAATQHHSRLRAPARQLGCRRDQRLLPWRVISPIAPASHRSGSASGHSSIPKENCKPGVSSDSAWHTAPTDISLRVVTTRAIRMAYTTALSKVCVISFLRTSAPVEGLSRACRGIGLLSELVSAIRRAEFLRHASGIES